MQQKLYREELLQIFPQKLRQRIEESVTFKNLTEIRLRADLPVLIETTQENYFLKKEEAAEKRRAIAKEEDNWILSPEQLKLIFEKISQYSVFAYTEEIGEGFITLKGGHRAGLCGKYYYRGEEKPQIKHISSINLRVAREVIGCAECIVPKLFEGNTFCHTLLISPPGCGKTTYLRKRCATHLFMLRILSGLKVWFRLMIGNLSMSPCLCLRSLLILKSPRMSLLMIMDFQFQMVFPTLSIFMICALVPQFIETSAE